MPKRTRTVHRLRVSKNATVTLLATPAHIAVTSREHSDSAQYEWGRGRGQRY